MTVASNPPATDAPKLAIGRAFSALVARGFAAAATIAMNLLIARNVTLADFGIFSLASVWVTIAGTVGCFGTDVVVTRFLAPAIADGDRNRAHNVVRWGLGMSIKIGLIAAVCSCLIIAAIFHAWSLERRSALMIACAAVPFYSMSLNSVGILKAVSRPSFAIAVETLFRPVAISLIMLIAFRLGLGNHPCITLAGIIVLAQVIVFAISCTGVPRDLRAAFRALRGASSSADARLLETTAVPVAAMNSLLVAVAMVDTLWVGYLAGPTTAGVYRVAVQLSNLVAFTLTATSASISSKVAQLCSTGSRAALQRVLKLAALSASSAAVLGGALLLLLARYILALYGAGFVAGYSVFCILLAAQVLNVLCGPTNLLIVMTGHEKVAFRTSVLTTIVVAAVGVLAIPWFGAYGAAVANASGVISWNVLLLVFLWREAGVDPSIMCLLRTREGLD